MGDILWIQTMILLIYILSQSLQRSVQYHVTWDECHACVMPCTCVCVCGGVGGKYFCGRKLTALKRHHTVID